MSRNDSDSAAPTRLRSTYGLAEQESQDGSHEQPPLASWRSTGNVRGAGTLPRPWTRQRTGTNVQKLLTRLQSQEDDGPRPAWADQFDDGRTTDAPRMRLRPDLTDAAAAGEARPRPRPRPRSMGVLLGLRKEDDAEEEQREVTRSARGRREDAGRKDSGAVGGVAPLAKLPSERRCNVLGTARSYEALDSRSHESHPGVSLTRHGDSLSREQMDRARDTAKADSYRGSRRAGASDLSEIRDEARWGESSPDKYVTVRVSTRVRRGENDDTDDKETLHRQPHTQTLPSTTRYKERPDATQTHPVRKFSAAEVAVLKNIKNAAKSASARVSDGEAEDTSAHSVPEKRGSLAKNGNSSAEEHERATTLPEKAPVEEAPKARSRRSAPPPDLISHVDGQQPQTGRARFRRVEVKPADDSDAEETKGEKKAGKVEMEIAAVKVKAVKAEVKSKAEAKAVSPVDQEAPVDSEAVKSVETQILVVDVDDKPAMEPKYKPVAAPRRLKASGMTLDQMTDPRSAPRVIDLRLTSDDYKKIRPRGTSRLASTKEARTKTVPMNERGSGLRARGEVQDFEKLRSECRRSGRLFEDPEFPATDCSIFFSRTPPRPFQWKRPHEICDNPKFILKGASRFDVQQGELGDCWLLAAVANITLNQELFAQVVPADQELDDDYAGIFHFRFWQYGRWVDVVIDDRLPTYHGQLAFMHSQDNREFWSALLEKAYAKLHGSYEALKGGTTCEAMEDFSGGVTEMYDIDQAPDNLFQVMMKANQRQSLMSCSIEPDPYVAEAEMPNGLIKGHAYSVTKACLADIETPRVQGKIPMVRVRNPWGNEAEWKGAFSDKSQEWNYIPEETRRELGLTFDADGEFWMTFKDFTRNFQRLEICNLSPDSLDDDEDEASRRWEMSVFEGAWVRGATAGGCRNYINTFAHNPQYRIQLHDVDEDDEEHKCTVIVAVMQKNRRAQRRLGLDCLTIGFSIYHLSDPDSAPKPLDAQFFRYNCSVARAPSFINLREVSCRFKLPPGTYCIIPSTFEPNEEGEFLIRIFSEKRNNMEENDEDVGVGQVSEEIKPELVQESEYDRTVRQFFTQIAGDNLEVDWRELKEVLDYALKKEFKFDGFSKDTIRSMVALLDVDNSGQLGLEEFKSLWGSIRLWKSVFKKHDQSGSSYLSGFQLRSALNESGYRVNNNMLNLLMHRYGDREGKVAFDDFMACAVKMKTCIEIFKDKDPRQTNKATFSLEDWMEHNMYS